MAYVYRHIRLDKNEPFYIGIGSNCTKVMYKRAKETHGRNKIWKDIVAKTKYAIEILIDNISIEEAQIREVYFISLYGKIINGGMLANLTDGGEGCLGLIHSDETKAKLSNAKKGRPSKMKGKKSDVRGIRHDMFGNTHSDELKAKWSKERKGSVPWNVGKKWGDGQVVTKKMKNAQVGRRIPVYQYDLNGVLVGRFLLYLKHQV